MRHRRAVSSQRWLRKGALVENLLRKSSVLFDAFPERRRDVRYLHPPCRICRPNMPLNQSSLPSFKNSISATYLPSPWNDLVWSPAPFHTYIWPTSGRGTHTRNATDNEYDITYVASALIPPQPAPSCNAQQTAANGFWVLRTRQISSENTEQTFMMPIVLPDSFSGSHLPQAGCMVRRCCGASERISTLMTVQGLPHPSQDKPSRH